MEKSIMKVVEMIIENLSDEFRNEIVGLVKRWEVKTRETKKNPWDDIFVMILKAALKIE